MTRVSSFTSSFATLLLLLGSTGCGDDADGGGGAGDDATASSTTGAAPTTGAAGDGDGDGDGDGGATATTGASTTTGGGGNDVCPQDPPHDPALPPARAEGAAAGDGNGALFAITRWYLGDTDRSGNASDDAWEGYGFDLDGLNTVDLDDDGEMTEADLVCSCRPAENASPRNLEDGPEGIDNGFGRSVAPILSALFGNPSELATDGVGDGIATVAFDLTTLGDEDSYDPVVSRLYELRDGETGTWQYAPESLENDDPTTPKVSMPTAYLAANTWVSGPIPLLEIPLHLDGSPLRLPVRHAVVTMDLDAAHGEATSGIVSGKLDAEELAAALGGVIGYLDVGLCPPSPTFDSIVAQLRGASDITGDGIQDHAQQCSAISIAIGFDAEAVTVSEVAPAAPPVVDPCEE